MGWFHDAWDKANPFKIIGNVWDDFTGASAKEKAQKVANDANIALQQKQQDWEERMSNTEVQRRTQDMRDAGLNPILSIMGMGSASTPNVQPPRVESLRKDAPDMGSSAVSALLAKASIANMRLQGQNIMAQTELTNAEAAKVRAEVPQVAGVQTAQIGSLQAGAQASLAQVNEVTARIAKLESEVKQVLAETKGREISNEQAQKLVPLVIQQRTLENRAIAAGIPEKEVRSQLAKMVGGGASLYQKLPTTKLGEWIGGKAADAADWFRAMRAKEADNSRRFHEKSKIGGGGR